MCGGSSTTTQSTTIPPEVLARYNAVNAKAEEVAKQPFQRYGGEFVAPINAQQMAGFKNINDASGLAQGSFNAAQQQLATAYGQGSQGVQGAANVAGAGYAAATPYYGQGQDISSAAYGQGLGQMQNIYGQMGGLSGTASPYLTQGLGVAQAAANQAAPQYQTALSLAGQGLGQGTELTGQAQGFLNNAVSQGQLYANMAMPSISGALSSAQPYMRSATEMTGRGLTAAEPMMGAAEGYLGGGTRAVNPQEFGQAQINKYMSPYMKNVVEAQQALQQQEAAAQRSALNSQAIGAGAFGGDRAGIAQANLARQQSLANQATLGNLLQQGYGQAAGMFQQQQGVDLAAQQANRAAQQFGAQQAAALGQQRFGQQLTAGQQMAGLGQQQFQQQLGQGQALAGLGQQLYGQGLGAAGQAAGLGQNIYGMNLGVSQNAQNVAQGMYGMGSNLGAMQQQTGQSMYNMGAQQAQMQQAAAQNMYQMGQQAGQFRQQTGQQMLGAAQSQAGLENALAQSQYGMGAQTAQAQAGLGAQQQAALLQGAQAQVGAGTLAQQTQQAQDTAQYQQFLQERGYPFQVAQFLANIAMGTGALSGSTTTTTQPNSFFSDRRLKKDIKEIGETHDGLPIYSFKYKGGDDQQRIGVMADEAREKHPDAVRRVNGVDAVDYEKIANRASEGGGVMPHRAGEGFAEGGHVMPEDLAAIIAMQKQFLGPHGEGGLYGQSAQNLPGQKGIVPQASLPVSRLPRHSAPQQQQSGMRQAMSELGQAEKLGETLFGDKGLVAKGKQAYSYVTGQDKNQPPAKTADQGGSKQPPAGSAKQMVQDYSKPKTVEVAPSVGVVKPEAAPQESMIGSALSDVIYPKDSDIFVPETVVARGGVIPHKAGGGHLQEKVLPYQSEDPYGVEAVNEAESGEKYDLLGSDKGSGKSGSSRSGLADAASLIGSVGTIAKGIGTIASLLPFSDERVKNGMERVGQLDNGQPVYKYRIGDGPTQLGLSAQNVSKYGDPSAVHRDRDGLLHLDYERATREYGGGIRPTFQEGGDAEKKNPLVEYRDYMIEKGLEPHVAAGIAGNIAKESNGNPTIWGDNDNSFGLFQKNIRGELPAYQKWAQENKRDMNDPKAQIDHVIERLNGPYANVYQKMRESNDPAQAAYQFAVGYERPVPATARYDERMKIAAQLAGGEYTGKGVAPQGEARRQVAGAEYVREPGKGGTTLVDGQPVQEGGLSGLMPTNFRTGKPFTSAGDFLTDRQFLVPLLTGVGAMASSPSRYFGGALLQGLGAAAQSYGGMEKTQQEISESQARTFETTQRAANLSMFTDPKTGYTMVRLANGQEKPLADWIDSQEPLLGGAEAANAARQAYERQGAAQRGFGAGTAAGAAASPATAPQAGEAAKPGAPAQGAPEQKTAAGKYPIPQGVVYDSDSDQRAKLDRKQAFMPGGDEVRAQSLRYANGVNSAANAAAQTRNLINEMTMNVANVVRGKGLEAPGFAFPARAQAVEVMNFFQKQFDPKGELKPWVISDLDTKQQLADKYNALIATATAAGANQDTLGALQTVYKAMPQTNMSPDAQAQLAAELLVYNRRELDRQLHLQRWNQASMNNPYSAGADFNEKNGKQYLQSIDLVKDLIRHDTGQLYQKFMKGQYSPEQIESFFKEAAKRSGKPYVPGMSRYFVGG